MTKRGTRNDALLALPEGGSLTELEFLDNAVVKRYRGKLLRGYDKLRNEYWFLKELPPRLRARFARPVLYLDRIRPRLTELHLRRQAEPAVAKAILRGLIDPARTRAIIAESLRTLVDDLYPLRARTLSGQDIYAQFHQPRLRAAVAALRRFPVIRDLVAVGDFRVNGKVCPSTTATVEWLDQHAGRYFRPARLVAAHGDAHLDNILATIEGPLRITFVDPRGEMTLPPHYDFAKMSKAVRTGYDLIHYGMYEIDVRTTRAAPRVDLALDTSFDAHYHAGLEVLTQAIPAYAASERVSQPEFLAAARVAELAHIVSFSAYHANHPRGCDTPRVVAYLAVAGLLARDLMRRQLGPAPDLVPITL